MSNRHADKGQHHNQHRDRNTPCNGIPIHTGFRLFFAPLFAARALFLLPASIFFRENKAAGSSAYAQQQRQGTIQQLRTSCGLSFTSDVSLVIPRITYCCQDWGLLWHAVVYNIVCSLVRILAAEGAVAALRRWIERLLNSFVGMQQGEEPH